MLALLLDPIFHVFQGCPGRNQPVDLVTRGIVRLSLAVGKRLGEPGDRVGVDRIVLGQPSGRLGEVANPFRIDDPDFDASGAQSIRPAALVTAARLHHRPADPVRPHPRHQLGPAFRRARRRHAQSLRTNAGVDFVLCNIKADNSRLLWHPPLPSLLVRALTPMQLFGFKEDAEPVPRSPSGFASGDHGLRSGDGRLLQQPPVRRCCHISRTQGGQRGSVGEGEGGAIVDDESAATNRRRPPASPKPLRAKSDVVGPAARTRAQIAILSTAASDRTLCARLRLRQDRV